MTHNRTSPPQDRADQEGTWNIEVRPQCSKCDRLAVVYDDDDRPYCGRHATIFLVEWPGRVQH